MPSIRMWVMRTCIQRHAKSPVIGRSRPDDHRGWRWRRLNSQNGRRRFVDCGLGSGLLHRPYHNVAHAATSQKQEIFHRQRPIHSPLAHQIRNDLLVQARSRQLDNLLSIHGVDHGRPIRLGNRPT